MGIGSKEEALEFERLRKQMAIQFEFLKQHASDWVPVWKADVKPDKWSVYYSHIECGWEITLHRNDESVRVNMPKEVAEKFCEMANNGVIEGLEVL